MSLTTIGVVGGGAWGTALAQVAAAAGARTPIWAREAEVVAGINAEHVNALFLPGIALSPAIVAVASLDGLADADALLIVTPAQAMATVLEGLAGQSPRPLVLCAKGIAPGGRSMVEVAAAALPDWPLAVLSGPTFAHEVAAGLPTAVTLACVDEALGEALCRRLALPAFRPYYSADVVGACIGGAVKNVLAIACGVVAGRRLGDNARAAVITRGFAEMLRYGLACGASAATLGGLSGLGDLVLTCTGTASRNFTLGVALGEERPPAAGRTVAEGAATAPVLAAAAAARGVEMPIVAAVAGLLDGSLTVEATILQLLSRPLRAEV
nr:NAD(P)H-dependent glycerol-3-phosphate dehydrogenase [Polymorphobacter sp.]